MAPDGNELAATRSVPDAFREFAEKEL